MTGGRTGRVAALTVAAVLGALLGTAAPQPAVAAGSRPYAGSGTWVSIFAGDAVWDRPAAQVRRMHRAGVRTLYLQTASSTSPVGTDVFRPRKVARFLVAAHARGMRVVAWYLPPLRDVRRELRRAMAAVDFRTASGQRFDGFALDIEPSATTPGGDLRDANLRRLSRRLRASVPVGYRLGAIVPSPVGMSLAPRFWPDFPWRTVARFYDAVLPMSYSTYRVRGAAATYGYTMRNIAFLRDVLGSSVAVHVIGGSAGSLGRAEARGFVAACNDARVTGASLWHWPAYGAEDRQEMAALDL